MDLLSGLSDILPEDRVLTGGEELERHGRAFFTYHTPHPPDAVVFPKCRDEVVQVRRFANELGIPVVPFGQGSSLEKHTIPRQGGTSLDMRLMGEILNLYPGDFVARVEPGLTHGKLNASLEEHSLFFPVDSGWYTSLGGMATIKASALPR